MNLKIEKMELREFSYTDNGRKLCFRVGQFLSFKSSNGTPARMVIHSITREPAKNGDKIMILVREEEGKEAVIWKEILQGNDGSITIYVYDYEKELDRD